MIVLLPCCLCIPFVSLEFEVAVIVEGVQHVLLGIVVLHVSVKVGSLTMQGWECHLNLADQQLLGFHQ